MTEYLTNLMSFISLFCQVRFVPYSEGFYHSHEETPWHEFLLAIDRVRSPFFWLVQEARCGLCPVNFGERINLCRFPWLNGVRCFHIT